MTRIVRFAALALVNALGIYLVIAFLQQGSIVIAVVCAAVVALVDVIYIRKGAVAAKYLTPGLIFLALFQVFVIVYTIAISFTNYGYGHNLSKPDAIESIIANSVERVDDSASYAVTMATRDGDLYLLVAAPNGDALAGSASTPLADLGDATVESGRVVSAQGFTILTGAQILERQRDIADLTVPFSNDLNDGFIRTADARTAYLFTSPLEYSAQDDAILDSRTGETYTDSGEGSFVSADGDELSPGWQAFVGVKNFQEAIGSSGRFEIVGVFVWTLVFAALSVLLSFAVGLGMALVLNREGLRFQRIYRAIMVFPYAFPVFLSGLVWSGLLNQKYGFINEVLLGGAQVPWLQDPWLAKLSVIFVSVWFGFPYFFLVCTGALQSLPKDVLEAAVVDGAGAVRQFFSVKLPLLLVSTSPLLIAGFAYSFNDFNTIFMLTGGGPTVPDSAINAGSTDILITLVYKQAFLPYSKDYGLASAFSVIIFVVVAVIAIALFRRTKNLEEVYR